MGCNQVSMESKHYMVSTLRPPCLSTWTENNLCPGLISLISLFMARLWQKHQIQVLKQQQCSDCSDMMPPTELLKCVHQFSSLVSLSQQSHSEQSFSSDKDLGPVVQSVVSLTSSLRFISLTVLADSIYNILIFFAEKMWVAFALQKLLTFFQQKISAYLRITRSKF